ncbi:single-stranded-DNA-specific exonuclease RecJ [Pannus brasiliensis CCIBt3594]|uniref:Single-stranded-DNA-specific exonuclease RecJ n=1 Tax=Pannus brasiliensis CCIBt3594 TaxID=1427578 RepID=A0AAW9R0R8_9CHRO
MTNWQIPPSIDLPPWYLDTIARYTPESDGHSVARILWQRGIRERGELLAFLDGKAYQPTSPFDFGQEMNFAVKRLREAIKRGEKVTIWGDFDADGVTATSVLWEGLGQFFPQYLQLDYYIPDRLTESHGLNRRGIDALAETGTRLIVTCDTGSTNLVEIDHANSIGIDIIITDHHTLPDDRPDVVALINPRYFIESHPLYHLSGVAVAYKLVEAMYETLPDIPRQPLENLLDLVAIGLIADLVQLRGDCRYLARKGIEKLQKQRQNPTRPGVAKLLEFCQRTGDRPTDISFGLGPRINAVSRVHGDARFCVELLTGQDAKRCQELAEQAELANTRRKEIQQDIIKQVKRKLERIDLSTTNVIILEDPQWQAGILGLVAGQIAGEYYRPTILLSTSEEERVADAGTVLAKGSARSIRDIDLYQLVASQSHLLHRFGGHPFAAGLSLPVENLPLFREGINQQLRRTGIDLTSFSPSVEVDLVVTVADLGQSLFRELKLLEPCGMGNPAPKLLIRDCWFTNLWQKNPEDLKGKKISYPRVTFEIHDGSIERGFRGVWWGHSKEDILVGTRYDAAVELDYNPRFDRYEIRLLALQPHSNESVNHLFLNSADTLIDWRDREISDRLTRLDPHLLLDCPTDWTKIYREYQQALAREKRLALAYSSPSESSARETWKNLVGIAKYLIRTEESISRRMLREKLSIGDRTLSIGLQALADNGIDVREKEGSLLFSTVNRSNPETIERFLEAIAEEIFLKQYFAKVPVETMKELLDRLDSLVF